jgi:hypothetical protein
MNSVCISKDEKTEVVTICDHLSRLRFSKGLPYAFARPSALLAANVLNSPKGAQDTASTREHAEQPVTNCDRFPEATESAVLATGIHRIRLLDGRQMSLTAERSTGRRLHREHSEKPAL